MNDNLTGREINLVNEEIVIHVIFDVCPFKFLSILYSCFFKYIHEAYLLLKQFTIAKRVLKVRFIYIN